MKDAQKIKSSPQIDKKSIKIAAKLSNFEDRKKLSKQKHAKELSKEKNWFHPKINKKYLILQLTKEDNAKLTHTLKEMYPITLKIPKAKNNIITQSKQPDNSSIGIKKCDRNGKK